MPRCKFNHNGTPTTKPGTDDDAKRIALSLWITTMLVFNGDEQPDQYHTPGVDGYTPTKATAKNEPATEHVHGKSGRQNPDGGHGESAPSVGTPPPNRTGLRGPVVSRQEIVARFRALGQQLREAHNEIDFLTKPD